MKPFVSFFVGVVVLGILALGWGVAIEPGLLTVQEAKIETANWPADRKPVRVLLISDVHAGAPHINLDYIDDVVTRSNSLRPDLILLLGDYVINQVVGGDFIAPETTFTRLAGLKARYGVVAVLGNQDWWFDGGRVRRALENEGITVLENQALRLETSDGAFWLAGIADDMTRRPDVSGTMAQITDDAPVFLVAHNTAVFFEASERVAVTFAGHSHGGQVYIPWLGAIVVPSRSPLRWAYGHIHESGNDMYVTSGIGTSILPIRINMPPEIAIVTVAANRSQDNE